MEPESYSNSAFFIYVTTKVVSAVFMAAAPLIFLVILHQGGLGTVPVYDRSGQVLFYINNVVAALAFSGVWFAFSALMFRYSKKAVAQLNKQRKAA
jgi:hypothetical protein